MLKIQFCLYYVKLLLIHSMLHAFTSSAHAHFILNAIHNNKIQFLMHCDVFHSLPNSWMSRFSYNFILELKKDDLILWRHMHVNFQFHSFVHIQYKHLFLSSIWTLDDFREIFFFFYQIEDISTYLCVNISKINSSKLTITCCLFVLIF